MSLIELSEDNVDIDLSQYNTEENQIFIISDLVKSISFTSNNKLCHVSIIVKERQCDLCIDIRDIMINSNDDICFDLRGNLNKNYKIRVNFSGYNEIYTNNNMCIALGNNHDVIFEGINGGVIRCERKISGPAFGSSIYAGGSSDIDFIGKGTVEFISDREGDAVGFNNSEGEKTIIRIYDNIKFEARGGHGKDIDSIKADISAGNGGNGVFIEGEGHLFNFSNKIMKLAGGNGGCNTERFGGGVCGNGGAAIKIGAGKILLKGSSILQGGDGGQIKEESKHYMSRGGKGGACIEVLGYNNIDTDIRICSNVKAYGGNGGCSHLHINEKGDFEPVSGGDGGNFLSNLGNNEVSLYTDDIVFENGIGGSCVYDENIKKGENGVLTKGNNIIVGDFKELQCENSRKQDIDDSKQSRENNIQEYKDENTMISKIKNFFKRIMLSIKKLFK